MTPAPTTAWKAKIAAIPGILSALEFGPEKALIALILLQWIDWLTGVRAAKKQARRITSDRATLGAKKKGMMWAYVSVAAVGLWLAPISTETARTAFAAVVCGFCWVEILSIAENGRDRGWPMPAFLVPAVGWLEPKPQPQPAERSREK